MATPAVVATPAVTETPAVAQARATFDLAAIFDDATTPEAAVLVWAPTACDTIPLQSDRISVS